LLGIIEHVAQIDEHFPQVTRSGIKYVPLMQDAKHEAP
jgi:hypothetical protein